jgi:CopG family transcriptional regulator, nickel-responsive regulator
MAVMIALVYDEERGGVPQRFFELERKYRQEVVSSLHVQLENNHRMEVIVVPGSGARALGNHGSNSLMRGCDLLQVALY